MRDAPEFVERAERLCGHVRAEFDAIGQGVNAAGGANAPARTALLDTADSLRAIASLIDILVGRLEGVLSTRNLAQRAKDTQ